MTRLSSLTHEQVGARVRQAIARIDTAQRRMRGDQGIPSDVEAPPFPDPMPADGEVLAVLHQPRMLDPSGFLDGETETVLDAIDSDVHTLREVGAGRAWLIEVRTTATPAEMVAVIEHLDALAAQAEGRADAYAIACKEAVAKAAAEQLEAVKRLQILVAGGR